MGSRFGQKIAVGCKNAGLMGCAGVFGAGRDPMKSGAYTEKSHTACKNGTVHGRGRHTDEREMGL